MRASGISFGWIVVALVSQQVAYAAVINPGGAGSIGTLVQGGIQARFIEVVRTDFTFDPDQAQLHVAEVEAFPFGATFVTPNTDASTVILNTNDLALHPTSGGQAIATVISGTGGHGQPDNLISGLRNRGGATTTRSPVGGEVRFRVDLIDTENLKTVRLWQRAEGCCQERLADVTVEVYADDGAGLPGALLSTQSHAGLVTPTNGSVTFLMSDEFILRSGDTLQIELNGSTGMADLLRVGNDGLGSLIIEPGATLELITLDSFRNFSVGQTFNVLDFGSLVGQFDTLIQSGDVMVDLSQLYTTGELTVLSVVPEPGSATLLLLGCTT